MLDDWFRTIRLTITFDEFERLPRHPAYKQEYYGGRCVLTPRLKGFRAVLNLAAFVPPEGRRATRHPDPWRCGRSRRRTGTRCRHCWRRRSTG